MRTNKDRQSQKMIRKEIRAKNLQNTIYDNRYNISMSHKNHEIRNDSSHHAFVVDWQKPE